MTRTEEHGVAGAQQQLPSFFPFMFGGRRRDVSGGMATGSHGCRGLVIVVLHQWL